MCLPNDLSCVAAACSWLLVACGSDDTAQLSIVHDAGHEASARSSDAGRDGMSSVRPQPDARVDAPQEARSPSDASRDSASGPVTDAVSDAEAASPKSLFCGDSIRDPVTEECDDGPDAPSDSCTSDCRVHNIHVGAPPSNPDAAARRQFERDLGTGRHIAAASSSGFGIVYVERHPDAEVWLQAFDPWGRRAGSPLNLAPKLLPTAAANPVVAALPKGHFAVLWSDAAAGTPDVVIADADAAAGKVANPVTVHSSLAGAQTDPDVVWTGTELVAAWTDEFDVKFSRYGSDLVPTETETVLAGTPAFEGNVALAATSAGWAAAWRVDDQGMETVDARAGTTEWFTDTAPPGPSGDHPALVELDKEHLLLFFTVGVYPAGSSTSIGRFRYAVLDMQKPGLVASQPFVPLTSPYDSNATLSQGRPNAARVGNRWFLAWQTASPFGDSLGGEVFIDEISWSANAPDRITQAHEWPLQVDAARLGDQAKPALGVSPLGPDGALITVWEDSSGGGSQNPRPDIVLGFRPVPFVTLPISDASVAKLDGAP